jgi:hypothetical protein
MMDKITEPALCFQTDVFEVQMRSLDRKGPVVAIEPIKMPVSNLV